jgi:hypothetical protein
MAAELHWPSRAPASRQRRIQEPKEAAMLSTLLIALAAVAFAVVGCAFIAPTDCVIDDREGAKDDAL